MNKKIIVSTLALAMGAALAGSISGSVAWYQYSTRANAEFQGVSAHCTENIQIRIKNATPQAWHSDLLASDVKTYFDDVLSSDAYNKLKPVTSGALAVDNVASSLKLGPRKGVTDPANWTAATANVDYVELPLELRVLDINGGAETLLPRSIYLTDVTIQASADNGTHVDLSPAVRVGILTSVGAADPAAWATIAKDTDPTSGATRSVDCASPLDLDNEHGVDQSGYSFQNQETYLYGAGNTFKTFATKSAADAAVGANGTMCYCTDTAKYYTSNGTAWSEYTIPQAVARTNALPTSGTDKGIAVMKDDGTDVLYGAALGTTTASNNLNVTLRIYLEGWQKISDNAVWSTLADTGAIGAKFDLGLRFETTIHTDH